MLCSYPHPSTDILLHVKLVTVSAKCPGRVATPAGAGASAYVGWGKAGKPPAQKSPARRVSSELGLHSSLKACTRLPWRRPESSLTQLKSLSWKPFLKDYRFNTVKYKTAALPAGTGGRAELCRLENSRRALVNDFNEKFTVWMQTMEPKGHLKLFLLAFNAISLVFTIRFARKPRVRKTQS